MSLAFTVSTAPAITQGPTSQRTRSHVPTIIPT